MRQQHCGGHKCGRHKQRGDRDGIYEISVANQHRLQPKANWVVAVLDSESFQSSWLLYLGTMALAKASQLTFAEA
jgi:hypothetical protein